MPGTGAVRNGAVAVLTPDAIRAAYDAAKPGAHEYELHSELHVAGKILRFPFVETGAGLEPADWFARVHGDGHPHEPGLLACLLALAGGRRIAFTDIGAAFGYWSAVAGALFPDCTITVVEPDRAMAAYARSVAPGGVTLIEALVAESGGSARVDRRNFAYSPDGKGSSELPTVSLEEVVPPASNALDVIKIDVEGWQARFLPGSADMLAKRGAVVLLELDGPAKLAPFDASNADTLAPLQERGYRMLCADHRAPDFVFEEMPLPPEANALALLLPPERI